MMSKHEIYRQERSPRESTCIVNGNSTPQGVQEGFRIILCLKKFYHDARSRRYLWVQPGDSLRSVLQRAAQALGSLPADRPRLAALLAGALLPPTEPTALLQKDDIIQIIPAPEDWTDECCYRIPEVPENSLQNIYRRKQAISLTRRSQEVRVEPMAFDNNRDVVDGEKSSITSKNNLSKRQESCHIIFSPELDENINKSVIPNCNVLSELKCRALAMLNESFPENAEDGDGTSEAPRRKRHRVRRRRPRHDRIHYDGVVSTHSEPLSPPLDSEGPSSSGPLLTAEAPTGTIEHHALSNTSDRSHSRVDACVSTLGARSPTEMSAAAGDARLCRGAALVLRNPAPAACDQPRTPRTPLPPRAVRALSPHTMTQLKQERVTFDMSSGKNEDETGRWCGTSGWRTVRTETGIGMHRRDACRERWIVFSIVSIVIKN